MRLALDSNVVLRLLEAFAANDDPHGMLNMIEGDHEFVLPSIVVGEVLAKLPKAKRAAMSKVLRDFPVLACDFEAAEVAGAIHNRAIDEGKAQQEPRQCCKCDAFIVATAWVNKCDGIVCYDKGMSKMASWLNPPLLALRPDEVVPQGSLFADIPSQHQVIDLE